MQITTASRPVTDVGQCAIGCCLELAELAVTATLEGGHASYCTFVCLPHESAGKWRAVATMADCEAPFLRDEAGEAGGRLGARASVARFAGLDQVGRPAVAVLERELARLDGELAELRDELLELGRRLDSTNRTLAERTEHLV